MDATKRVMILPFLGLVLASCSIETRESSFDAASYDEGNSDSSQASSSSESSSSNTSSRSARERNPFSIPGDSTYYTVSIYQSYYIKRGDDGEPIYGNPRFDFSMTIKHGETLYSTVDDYHALLGECHPIIHSVGGTHSIIGFYSDKGCKHDIPYDFKVTSGMNAYYYCD